MNRLTYLGLVLAIVIWMVTSASTGQQDLVRTLFRVFVPLSFVGGAVGMARILSQSYRGLEDLRAGTLLGCIFLIAWGLDAGRAMVRRTAVDVGGFRDAQLMESNTFRAVLAWLLVIAGLALWRWAMRWPCFQRVHGIPLTGEIAWSATALAWVAVAVFCEPQLEQALIWLYLTFAL